MTFPNLLFSLFSSHCVLAAFQNRAVPASFKNNSKEYLLNEGCPPTSLSQSTDVSELCHWLSSPTRGDESCQRYGRTRPPSWSPQPECICLISLTDNAQKVIILQRKLHHEILCFADVMAEEQTCIWEKLEIQITGFILTQWLSKLTRSHVLQKYKF